jgi:hypothetical protein
MVGLEYETLRALHGVLFLFPSCSASAIACVPEV